MTVEDLDTLGYRDAWARQEAAHAEVVAGGDERLLIVEHPPTVTLGRRADDSRRHLCVTPDELKRKGIDLVESDRGGDVTYHGPGQIVAYPVVRLADHGLSVGGYVRLLQEAVVACVASFGVAARLDPGCVGVWADRGDGAPAKLCAFGVRVRRGATLHGLALNVETDLRYFDLIVPCGIEGRGVTSLRRLLGRQAPSFAAVKAVLVRRLVDALNAAKPGRPTAPAPTAATPRTATP